jgi:hypothetical protein
MQLVVSAQQRHPANSKLQGFASTLLESLLRMANIQRVTASGTRLGTATLQQLNQAGILQHLPALMANAAQGLTAVAGRQSSSISSRRCVGCECEEPSQQLCEPCRDAFAVAVHMLSVYYSMCEAWPHPGSAATVACLQPAPAVVQLVLAAFDAVHALQQRHQQHYQQQQQQQGQVRQGATAAGSVPRFQPNSGQGTMFLAITAQLVLTTEIGSYLVFVDEGDIAPSNELNELLRSPQLLRCLTLMACVTVMALAASSGGDSGGSGGSRGGGGSSGNNRSRRTNSIEQAMAQIQEQKQQGSCGSSWADGGDCSFPVSLLTDRLFELLGVDRATVQYAVRMAPPVSSTNALQVAHLISSQFWLDEVSCVSIRCWHAVLCCAVLYCAVHMCVITWRTQTRSTLFVLMQHGHTAS